MLASFLWETANGTSELWIKSNNPAGITCGDTYCSYDSKEQGLRAMFELTEIYINYHGLKTVDAIRKRWSEADDSIDVVTMWKQILGG